MYKNNYVIDGHSHFGKDYFHGDTNLNDYINLMEKVGIDYALMMPTPCPIKYDNFEKKKYLGWYILKNEIVYYSDLNHELSNPFEEVNYEYYEEIIKKNKSNLFFIPIVHPMLDTTKYLEKLIADINPIALKLHGVGEGIDPTKVPVQFTSIIKKYNIPLIIHTDYDNGNKIIRYDTYLLRNLNAPMKWIEYLKSNNINGILNHGCALDYEALNIINNSNLIKVGLGPDLIIEHDVDRLKINTSSMKISYLKKLKDCLNNNKIIFDVDYNWNIHPISKNLDYNFLDRISTTWPNDEEQNNLFFNNIVEHMPKLKCKIKKENKIWKN